MSDAISQDEIDALLNGGGGDNATPDESKDSTANVSLLTAEERDVLGEVGNISMGSAATTLSALLSQKVNITTPMVKEKYSLAPLLSGNEKYVAIDIKYKAGLDGSFMLIIKEADVQIIANVMMGGEPVKSAAPVTDMQLSAISEAMNQMVGTSCTSMSQVFDSVVDIDPPKVVQLTLDTAKDVIGFDLETEKYVVVEFDLTVGDILESKMMQLLPIDVAKQLISKLMGANKQEEELEKEVAPAIQTTSSSGHSNEMQGSSNSHLHVASSHASQQVINTDAQSIEFEDLLATRIEATKEQISLIQDVPLEVVVELGRTQKSIKEILEFSPGVVIELNKMAGEPIDILINNKFIAKGEVVVIDENFGIRITEIIDVNKRI